MLKGMPQDFYETLERITDVTGLYRDAWWLLSQFEDPVWKLLFPDGHGGNTYIDWAVRFGSGLLTDSKYADTLKIFKTYLIVLTHPVTVGGKPIGDAAARNTVRKGCRIIDYFLLNQGELKLATYGFGVLTENDIANLLYRFERGPDDSEAIYDWTSRLSGWLNQRLHELEPLAGKLVARHVAFREHAIPAEDWTLKVESDRLALWKAVLWIEGCYKHGDESGFRFVPHTVSISSKIYPETLVGGGRKPRFEELCLYPIDDYEREYGGINVRTGEGEGPSAKYLRTGCRTVQAMLNLELAGFSLPNDAFQIAQDYKPVAPERMASVGRFRNPPFWQVLDGIKQATAFCAEHGDDLLDSYFNILVAARDENRTCYALLLRHDIRDFLTPGAVAMGVKHWCLRMRSGGAYAGKNYKRARDMNAWERERFFAEFRHGRGLLQNIRVFYGAMSHVMGPMTARRQSELLRLRLKTCLDESRQSILFENAKSGALGVREKETRPIPPVVAVHITQVERFHDKLVEARLLDANGNLFALPAARGMCIPTSRSFNGCLDAFCDFFETPLDDKGLRHYLREHQFRRFFIIAFFFSARTRNLDTLRWFVAHVDAEHLWYYLTNNVAGDMYREVAAYFLTEELRLPEEARVVEIHEAAYEHLASHLGMQFGTRKFSLIDYDTLEAYLESELDSGVMVEPEFFPFVADFPYKIVVKLRRAA
ncbi:hypothetical protein [Caballeronia sordidicola]|uniref:hypothetical protein n=1 Tax=Caballeronia sordidicola TaxID=196367 RepID=UPI0004CFF675|nr:hypothetical protein [Caballeronia sordidicola]